MSGAESWYTNCSDGEQKEHECRECGCMTSEADFESIDDELNEQLPLCPDCQSLHRTTQATCDCGEPASYEVDSGFLCDNCHDHYVSGYIRD